VFTNKTRVSLEATIALQSIAFDKAGKAAGNG